MEEWKTQWSTVRKNDVKKTTERGHASGMAPAGTVFFLSLPGDLVGV